MIVKWQKHLLRGPCDGLTSHLLGVMPLFLTEISDRTIDWNRLSSVYLEKNKVERAF